MQTSHRVFISFLLALYAFAMFFCVYSLDNSGIGTAIIITVVLIVAIFSVCLLLKRDGLCRDFSATLMVMAPFCAMLIARVAMFDIATNDYTSFLHPWYEMLKSAGGLAGLKTIFDYSNYNVPYITWLAIFTYIPVYDLYLIKLLSVLFDILLAYFLFKITSQLTDSPWARVVSFVATMILPTIFINGAVWGQCDSIYAAFTAAALYFAIRKPRTEINPRNKNRLKSFIRKNSVLVYLFAALALGYKLQSIFVFPIIIALLFTKRLSLKYIWVFPAVYVLSILPALLAGRGFIDTLFIYSSELGTVGSGLNYNSPSMFSLRWEWENAEQWASTGTSLAFVFVLLVLVIAYIKRKRLSNLGIVIATVLLAIGVPTLLPHMHERYFILGEVLTLPLACAKPKLTPLIFLTAFAALLGYHAYLFLSWFVLLGRWYLTMNYGFWALAIAILTLFIAYIYYDRKSNSPAPQVEATSSVRVVADPYASRSAQRNRNSRRR